MDKEKQELMRRFAPAANGVSDEQSLKGARIDILVCTDSVSEGLNLQNPDRDALVIHYDMPWTPRSLMQRCGPFLRKACGRRPDVLVQERPCRSPTDAGA